MCLSVRVEVSVFKGFSGRTLRNAFGKKGAPSYDTSVQGHTKKEGLPASRDTQGRRKVKKGKKERERERERASESEGGREGGRGGKKWRKAEMMQQFMMRALPGRVCACHPYFARKEPLDKQVCPCLLNFGVLIRFLRAAQIANAKDSSIQLALQLERLFN